MTGLAAACTLALVACSSRSSSSASAGSTATASSTAAAASKVTLVVYSAQGYDSAMTKAFTQATGIPVKLDDNSTGPRLLVAAVAIPLALQARALRGRSYAVLSGRTRQAVRRQLGRRSLLAAASGVAFFFVIALGVPGFGAVSGSLLADYGGSFALTLVNYRALFAQAGLIGPLERSLGYATITATITVIGGFIAARLLARRRTRATGALDFLLLASVALPGVVFGAGYIFAYNLRVMSRLGIDLYQTVTLLIIAYTASSLPTNARVLVGAVSQLQASLKDAARTHGAGALASWTRGVLPVVSRPIVMAWLFTFCGVFLELPLSQLLYAPGSPPASIAIEDNLSNYHSGVGMAQSVLAVAIALAAVGVVLGCYRLLAPAGWRRIGSAVGGGRG